jgi:glucokinase
VILAGDIGATNSRLGLFDADGDRPHARHVLEFSTVRFQTLTEVVAAFLESTPNRPAAITAACFGVAGPVLGDIASLTNVNFTIDARAIASAFRIPRVALQNDLAAMAHSVRVLRADELRELQSGAAATSGNMALIAAGTGLGQAVLHEVGGQFIPVASESGHADWSARTERDIVVLRALVARYERAEIEQVVSGMGLRNLHRVLHTGACAAGITADDGDVAAALTKAALERRCASCIEALEVFVDAYGAESGNLALRCLATRGVFIGGGIAPKILPALTDGRFMRAFNDKGSMRALVERVPVRVILNPDAGLLGAAVHAASLAS